MKHNMAYIEATVLFCNGAVPNRGPFIESNLGLGPVGNALLMKYRNAGEMKRGGTGSDLLYTTSFYTIFNAHA